MDFRNLTKQLISKTYGGLLHTANVPVDTNNLPIVYDGLGNETSLRIGKNGISINGCLSASCIDSSALGSIFNTIFPIGAVFFSVDNVNPSTRMVGTTWERVSQGKFIAGVGSGVDSNNVTATIVPEEANTIGEYYHQLTEAEMPRHRHTLTHPDTGEQFFVINDKNSSGGGVDISRKDGPDKEDDARYYPFTNFSGENSRHNNIPPTFGLYIWKRIG
jgi:hypothetical protein